MPDRQNFEIVIVGAGPAGLAAANMARSRCTSIAVIDENAVPGGQIYRGRTSSLHPSVSKVVTFLRQSGVTILNGCSVYDAPCPGILWVQSAGGPVEIGYQKLILATGAREIFLPFPGWTLPNVMGVGALQALIKGGWKVEGKRIVVAGSGPLLMAVGAAVKSKGADLKIVAEQADWAVLAKFSSSLARYPRKWVQGIPMLGTVGRRYQAGHWVREVHGVDRVEHVTLENRTKTQNVECDVLACSFGFVPNVELPLLLGCDVRGGDVAVDAYQRTSVRDVFCVGEPTGVGGVELSAIEGSIGGLAAIGNLDLATRLFAKRQNWRRFADQLDVAFELRPEVKRLAEDGTIVCRCEDVRMGELIGCESARAAKLHTRCGMGACQGRICGAATRTLFGWEQVAVRPPLSPVPLAGLCELTGAETQLEGRN